MWGKIMRFLDSARASVKAAVAGAFALGILASTASAGVLTNGGGTATVNCTPSCEGVTGGSIAPPVLGSLSLVAADLYAVSPNNEATEAAALNALVGTSFVGTDGSKTDAGGVDSLSFATVAEWIVLKLGAGTFFLHNTSGPVQLDIDYVKAGGSAGAGGGLSHYTEFGTSEIPLPAAAWLMIAGIGGLGFASRKKKAA